MADQPAGPVLDELGVTLDLDEHDRLAEVLVLGKLVDEETGEVRLLVASNRLNWISQAGLATAFLHVQRASTPTRGEL